MPAKTGSRILTLCGTRAFGLGLALVILSAAIGASPALAQSSTYGTDQNYCDRGALANILSTSKSNILGSAAGAAIGGLLGSKMGGGSGNTLLTIAGVLGGALAGGYIGRSMDPADQACVGQTLQNTPNNQTVAWRDPQNGASYWVTPTRSYTGPNGEPCRDYITQAVVNGQTQRTNDVACRDARGAWQSRSAANEAPAQRAPAGGSGLSKDMILKVQSRLHDLGFYVRDNIDGIWGPNTETALRNFQRTKNLAPTGQINIDTLNALGLANEGQSAPAAQN